jgi:hypothetical protein
MTTNFYSSLTSADCAGAGHGGPSHDGVSNAHAQVDRLGRRICSSSHSGEQQHAGSQQGREGSHGNAVQW